MTSNKKLDMKQYRGRGKESELSWKFEGRWYDDKNASKQLQQIKISKECVPMHITIISDHVIESYWWHLIKVIKALRQRS